MKKLLILILILCLFLPITYADKIYSGYVHLYNASIKSSGTPVWAGQTVSTPLNGQNIYDNNVNTYSNFSAYDSLYFNVTRAVPNRNFTNWNLSIYYSAMNNSANDYIYLFWTNSTGNYTYNPGAISLYLPTTSIFITNVSDDFTVADFSAMNSRNQPINYSFAIRTTQSGDYGKVLNLREIIINETYYQNIVINLNTTTLSASSKNGNNISYTINLYDTLLFNGFVKFSYYNSTTWVNDSWVAWSQNTNVTTYKVLNIPNNFYGQRQFTIQAKWYVNDTYNNSFVSDTISQTVTIDGDSSLWRTLCVNTLGLCLCIVAFFYFFLTIKSVKDDVIMLVVNLIITIVMIVFAIGVSQSVCGV